MVRAVGNPIVSAHVWTGRGVMSQQGSSGPEDDSGPRRGEISPEERDAFRKRASELGARLDKAKADARNQRDDPRGDKAPGVQGAAFGQALKISVELVVGIAVGGFIGKVLDDYFETKPIFLIVFLMLGFAAGLLNIIRAAQRMQAQAEPLQRNAAPVVDEEEDR